MFKQSIKWRPVFFLYLCFAVPLQAAETTNSLGMRLTSIPAGTFIMGTRDVSSAMMEVPESDAANFADETPAHPVTISHSFYIGTTEITQAQWFAVMENKPGPEKYWQQKNWRDLPVVSISWGMANRFVDELNKKDKKFKYRLPSEAEWEYAARAGSTESRPWSEGQLEDYAWFINNSGDKPQPVATKKPNAFGLYDMIGNAWEWTADWYASDAYTKQGKTKQGRVDPQSPKKGSKRVRRGGSYHCPLHMTRVAYRAADNPGSSYSVLGFRVLAELR